jgi:plastocyanin
LPAQLRPLLVIAAAAVAAFVLTGGGAQAQGTTLRGTVGPDFTISLVDASGGRVTHLENGTYTIAVDDRSPEHNFHLLGPGVDQHTDVEFVGAVTWTVTVNDGNYTYFCDPHFSQMKGAFTAGVAPTTTTTTTPKPKPANKLAGTVGPGNSISLKKTSGSLKAGKFTISVRDKSKAHNFHLSGPGVNKSTSVAFVGSKTWTVTLKKGTYRFQSDPQKSKVKGSLKIG